MTRLHGWAPRGERLVGKVPQGHWKTGPDDGCDCRKPAPRLIRNATNGRIDKTIKQFYKQKPRSKSISGNLPTRQSSEQATATAKHPPAPESSLGRFQATRAALDCGVLAFGDFDPPVAIWSKPLNDSSHHCLRDNVAESFAFETAFHRAADSAYNPILGVGFRNPTVDFCAEETERSPFGIWLAFALGLMSISTFLSRVLPHDAERHHPRSRVMGELGLGNVAVSLALR